MGSVSNIISGTMTSGYQGYGSRVHDLETARSMFDAFAAAGYRDVDTADGYGNGPGEQMLGIWASRRTSRPRRGSRPCRPPHGHEPDILKHSVRTSLERLGTGSAAILYLAYRDSGTPPEDTLRAVDELHREGVFGEFGLSNFGVADVQTVRSICSANRWVLPGSASGGPPGAPAASQRAAGDHPGQRGSSDSLALLRYCPGLQVARLAAASRSASALISPPSSTAIPVR
jgi:aflatoxin B1 aldehyde reductase